MALKAFSLLVTGCGQSLVKHRWASRLATGRWCTSSVGSWTNRKPRSVTRRQWKNLDRPALSATDILRVLFSVYHLKAWNISTMWRLLLNHMTHSCSLCLGTWVKLVSIKTETLVLLCTSHKSGYLCIVCSIFVQYTLGAGLNNGEDKLWFCEGSQLWSLHTPVDTEEFMRKPRCWRRVVSFGGSVMSYF